MLKFYVIIIIIIIIFFAIVYKVIQSILKEIDPEYSWDGLVLKLKLQYFGHLVRKT